MIVRDERLMSGRAYCARRERRGKALVRRYTFVIQIHPAGVSTLENLSTAERVRLSELDQVGPQIERWMAGLERLPDPGLAGTRGNGEGISTWDQDE